MSSEQIYVNTKEGDGIEGTHVPSRTLIGDGVPDEDAVDLLRNFPGHLKMRRASTNHGELVDWAWC